MVHTKKTPIWSSMYTSKGKGKEDGNILVLGIGIWFVVIALAFAIMVAADLYTDKRDLAAEADYIALSLVDDIEESSYYDGDSDFRLSDSELARRALSLVRSDSEVIQVGSLPDGSIYVELKRTVPVFTLPALTNVGDVDVYASSTAYLRNYQTP